MVIASLMRRSSRATHRSHRLALSPTVLVLLTSVLLAGCSSSTDTASTVADTASTVASSGTGEAQRQTVTVGHTKDLSNAPIYIAISKGYFKHYGVDVHEQIITSGATGMSLVATDHLDVVQAGLSGGFFNSVNQGLDLKVVGAGNILPAPTAGSPGGLLVRKSLIDSGQVKTIADLRGKKIALTGGLGAALSYLADTALKEAGLSVSDMKAVNVAVPDTETALASGAVDAAVGVEPYATAAVKSGAAVVLSKLPEGVGIAATIVNSKFLKGTGAQGFYNGMARAMCDLRPAVAKSGENLKVLATALGVPADQVKDTPFYAFSPAPGISNLEAMQALWLRLGQLDYNALIPTDKYVDSTLATKSDVKCPTITAASSVAPTS